MAEMRMNQSEHLRAEGLVFLRLCKRDFALQAHPVIAGVASGGIVRN